MHHRIDAAHGRDHRLRVPRVAPDELEPRIPQNVANRVATVKEGVEHLNVVPAREQLPAEDRSDVAGAADDEDATDRARALHVRRLFEAVRASARSRTTVAQP